MANRLAFQTQLASIMEVLANAAVAEICKLVDDDYAVINLQMSQCQRENKALKRKLHLLELRMARGYAERRIRENSLNRSNRVQVNAALSDKYRNNAAGVFSNQDELFGRQMSEDIWRERDPTGAEVPVGHPGIRDEETSVSTTILHKQKPEESNKSGSSSLLVKAETSEEGHTQQLFIREDGVAEVVCEPGQTDFGSAQTDRADAHRAGTRLAALEVSGSDEALKSEPRFENAESVSQKPPRGAGGAAFGPRGDRVRPSCSYAPGSGRTPGRDRPEVIEVESAEEPEARHGAAVPLGRHRLNHFAPAPPGQSYPATPDLRGWQQPRHGAPYRPRHQRAASEKLFCCKFCGKAFNRPKKVEIHQRIHTGEKPFRCSTCGKFFAEAGNLKKHQKVHTGERPYSCTQCGKSFAWIRNLRTHQQKYHPDVFMAEELKD